VEKARWMRRPRRPSPAKCPSPGIWPRRPTPT
jgi:hypothetical protein